jgi:hypothetical protein
MLNKTITQYAHELNPVSDSNEYLSEHVLTGNFGEDYIYRLLVNSGYIVRKTSKLAFSGDLQVTDPVTGEFFKIEVKTANQHPTSGQFRFCLKKTGKTDCTYSDYVILVCIDTDGRIYLYCAHCNCFNGATHVGITSHPTKYKGKYAAFRIRKPHINFDDIATTVRLWSNLPC